MDNSKTGFRIPLTVPVKEEGFITFARKFTDHLIKTQKNAAARKAKTTLNNLMRFTANREIPFMQFNSKLMEEYEGWMLNRGVSRNTSSFYMRSLRTIYKAAVEEGLTNCGDPFKNVYTGVSETIKRAVPLRVIYKIGSLDLEEMPSLDFARNVFMLSFYLRGISFVDMCFLQKKDLACNVLSYRRHKTGKLLQIKLEMPIRRLIAKLGESHTPFLLPLLDDDDNDTWRQYERVLRRVNRNLKAVGRMAGLDTTLTTYVAQHSWASAAKSHHIPLETISEGLGHGSPGTTKIYLESLDTSVIDRANRKIIKLLSTYDPQRP